MSFLRRQGDTLREERTQLTMWSESIVDDLQVTVKEFILGKWSHNF